MSGIETVILNNGAKEAESLVGIAFLSLRSLITDNPIAFYELVMKCRDNNHELFGKTGELLKKISFLDVNGNIHGSIRNIVLSATEGEGMDMKLINPIKKAAEEIKETLEKIPELEDTNFRIASTNRKIRTDSHKPGSQVKVKENPEGDVREYVEGPHAGEQLFTQKSAERETKKAGKKLPASPKVYTDIIDKKYKGDYQNFLLGEKIPFVGRYYAFQDKFIGINDKLNDFDMMKTFTLRCADNYTFYGNKTKGDKTDGKGGHEPGLNNGFSVRCVK